MLALALEYQDTLFPEDLRKQILTVEYFLWSLTFLKEQNDWNLPLNTSYRLKIKENIIISSMSQSFTCLVMTGEGSFDIRPSALKVALNLEEEVWWCLARFPLLVQDLLSDYKVQLT